MSSHAAWRAPQREQLQHTKSPFHLPLTRAAGTNTPLALIALPAEQVCWLAGGGSADAAGLLLQTLRMLCPLLHATSSLSPQWGLLSSSCACSC